MTDGTSQLWELSSVITETEAIISYKEDASK